MADSILQAFLDNSFIKTDDTEHIDKLNKASAEVQKRLTKKKPLVIPYTLVALDPTISDDEPIIGEVQALIIKQWSTFLNSVAKTNDTPIAYIQAVILEALSNLSKDANLAAIIWHTARNIISYYKLAGRGEVLNQFLLEIGEKVEAVGRYEWRLLDNIQIDDTFSFEHTLSIDGQGKVGEEKLRDHLLAAAVHTPWAAQSGGGENPSNPAANNGNWAKFYAERSAKGLSAEINAALSTQQTNLTEATKLIQSSIESHLAKLKPHLELVSSTVMRGTQSLQKRTGLLWWKEALYSSRLNSGYRSLKPLALSIAMATDLADSVTPIYPTSVDYFLKETLRDVLGELVEKKTLVKEIFGQLQQFSVTERLLLIELCSEDDGRKSFSACLSGLLNESINIGDFFQQTGIEEESKISLGELTTWLFHDLQANKLAKAK